MAATGGTVCGRRFYGRTASRAGRSFNHSTRNVQWSFAEFTRTSKKKVVDGRRLPLGGNPNAFCFQITDDGNDSDSNRNPCEDSGIEPETDSNLDRVDFGAGTR
jgi:hypothetical protein